MPEKLKLGKTVVTPGVGAWIQEGAIVTFPGRPPISPRKVKIRKLLDRHANGDWGEVCDEDREVNELSIRVGLRVLSVYTIGVTKFWIITEADRSSTTVLFPNEY